MKKPQLGLTPAATASILLLFPAIAHANMISPVIQDLSAHLCFGNAIIGLIEGAVIARVFKVSAGRVIPLMIAGNYFSMWSGTLGLYSVGWRFKDPLARLVTLDSLSVFVWLLVPITFAGSVILEWPFCLAAMYRKPQRIRQSFYACLLAQAVSYALILLLTPPLRHFVGSGRGSSGVVVAPVASFADARNAFVYFISAMDGDAYRVRPDGSSLEKVASPAKKDETTKLLAVSTDDATQWRLCIERQYGFREYASEERTDTGVTVRGLTGEEPDRAYPARYESGAEPRRGDKRAVDLRPEDRRPTKVRTRDLGWDTRIDVEPRDSSSSDRWFHLNFDGLVLHWTTRNATVLPSGQIVYQLGNQIVLLDVDKRKLGLIALGRGPVVFLDPEPTSRGTATAPHVTSNTGTHDDQLTRPPEQRLDVLTTVKPDTDFRIFRRRPKNNYWDDGSPFDRSTAVAVLKAVTTAAPWDNGSHAAAYGLRHAHTPGITISLTWCKDIRDKSQRDAQSIHLCYGNWLFWYGDAVYQLSGASHDVLGGIFPENK